MRKLARFAGPLVIVAAATTVAVAAPAAASTCNPSGTYSISIGGSSGNATFSGGGSVSSGRFGVGTWSTSPFSQDLRIGFGSYELDGVLDDSCSSASGTGSTSSGASVSWRMSK